MTSSLQRCYDSSLHPSVNLQLKSFISNEYLDEGIQPTEGKKIPHQLGDSFCNRRWLWIHIRSLNTCCHLQGVLGVFGEGSVRCPEFLGARSPCLPGALGAGDPSEAAGGIWAHSMTPDMGAVAAPLVSSD